MNLDIQIGLNVTTARIARHMSQEAMAEAMRRSGWKWSQATAWAVESGKRPLRLSEAASLAAILSVEITDFLVEPQVTERPQPVRGNSTHLARIRELEAELAAAKDRPPR